MQRRSRFFHPRQLTRSGGGSGRAHAYCDAQRKWQILYTGENIRAARGQCTPARCDHWGSNPTPLTTVPISRGSFFKLLTALSKLKFTVTSFDCSAEAGTSAENA